MSFILQDVGLVRWGVEYQTTEKLIPNTVAFSIDEVVFQWDKLSVICSRSPSCSPHLARHLDEAGKAMRATSQDQDAAAMMGINVNRTISFTFALAGGLAGAGGLLYFITSRRCATTPASSSG